MTGLPIFPKLPKTSHRKHTMTTTPNIKKPSQDDLRLRDPSACSKVRQWAKKHGLAGKPSVALAAFILTAKH